MKVTPALWMTIVNLFAAVFIAWSFVLQQTTNWKSFEGLPFLSEWRNYKEASTEAWIEWPWPRLCWALWASADWGNWRWFFSGVKISERPRDMKCTVPVSTTSCLSGPILLDQQEGAGHPNEAYKTCLSCWCFALWSCCLYPLPP